MRRRGGVATAAAGAATLACALPWIVDGYTISLATNALILAVLALSVHLLAVAGLPSFGQTAYLGVGAYTTALLCAAGLTCGPVHLLAAAAAGAVAAALVGPVILRTRGQVFLMVTFTVGQLAGTAISTTPALGSDEGLSTPAITLPGGMPMALDGYLYLYTFAVFVPVVWGTAVLLRSGPGLIWRAIADNEPRMAALGYQTSRHLLVANVASGAMAAAGGALLVAAHRFVSPADLGFDVAALALLAVAIGAGRLAGTIAGAVLIVAVRDLLGAATAGHGTALLGGVFLVVAYGRWFPGVGRVGIRAGLALVRRLR